MAKLLSMLNQLPVEKHTSQSEVTAALERRYGQEHQTEVYHVSFRVRIRGLGESLTHLKQDLEVLVWRETQGRVNSWRRSC